MKCPYCKPGKTCATCAKKSGSMAPPFAKKSTAKKTAPKGRGK